MRMIHGFLPGADHRGMLAALVWPSGCGVFESVKLQRAVRLDVCLMAGGLPVGRARA